MKIFSIIVDIILLAAGLTNIVLGALSLFNGSLFGLFNLAVGIIVIALVVFSFRRNRDL